MCGIVAWISKKSAPSVRSGPLSDAVNQLRHRGPDRQQIFLWNDENCLTVSANEDEPCADQSTIPIDQARPVGTTIHATGRYDAQRFRLGLGHSRLSIIDLTDQANQPMTSPDGRYTLVFNGEIYNYIEIAEDLRSHGVVLTTASDTEVLLQALILFGKAAISKLNGMWAFAFFDRRAEQLIVSRDRFGKKPLFYFRDDQQWVLASEFKAIFAIIGESKRQFNESFLHAFLENDWPNPADFSTAYQQVYAVQPGSVMTLGLADLSIRSEPIETVDRLFERASSQCSDIVEAVSSAVQLRLRSDVPTAILLSGGVDSSIVAGFANLAKQFEGKIRWYTGDTRFGNDLPFAVDVAKSLNVEMKTIDVADPVDAIELLFEMNRQYEIPIRPLGNSVAMYLMYKAMAQDGIRVVLDGTGGDEIFGGYFSVYAKNVVTDHIRHSRFPAAKEFIAHCAEFGHFDAAELRRHADLVARNLYRIQPSEGPEFLSLDEAQMNDIKLGGLPRWLYMNDQNSMAHSIEARSPMLDYRLLKFLKRPVSEKFNNGFNKLALRQALPGNISDAVRWRRDKQGFRYNPAYAIRNQFDRVIEIVRSSDFLRTNYSAELETLSSETPIFRLMSMCSIAILEQVNAQRRLGSRRKAG